MSEQELNTLILNETGDDFVEIIFSDDLELIELENLLHTGSL